MSPTDLDLTTANTLASAALSLIKAELAVPPRPAVNPNALALLDAVEQLDKQLTLWADRDTDAHAPGVTRKAVNDAVTTLDFVLAQAHRVRETLVTQIRRYDDATAVRVDALLAEAKARRAAHSSPVEGKTTASPDSTPKG